MENFNIPYRKLRDNSRAKTGKTSPSLLQRHTCKHMEQSSIPKGKQFSMMTQNVTRYQHMLKHPHAKENYIDWIVKLREPIQTNGKTGEPIQYSVPSVFNKTTESRENYLKEKKISTLSYNSADFLQVLSRKQCTKHIEDKTLDFMTSLRNQEVTSKERSQKSKFINIPFKDRKEFPTFLSKESIKKTTGILKEEKETGFDGAQNFPSYPSKITQEKNFGLLQTFTNAHPKHRSSMPTIAWQMGLRN